MRRVAFAPPYSNFLILLFAAFALSLLIIRLPVEVSLVLIGGAALAVLSIWEPVVGLGLAIILGPAKAFLAIARPEMPSDLGQVFFALALAGWLARNLTHRQLAIPRVWLLLPLSAYVLVGMLSLIEAVSLEEGLKEAVKWIEVVVGVVILVSESERGRLKWIVVVILVAGVVQAAIGIWQYAFRGTGPEHFRIAGDLYRAYGSFEQPNPYGGFLGLIWPIAAGLAWSQLGALRASHFLIRHSQFEIALSALFTAVTLLCLGALYFSQSRGAWLGAAAAGLVMAMFVPRRWILGVGLVLAATAAAWAVHRSGLLPSGLAARLASVADFTVVADVRGVNINDANFAIVERLAHWQAAQAMAEARPWLGVGLGNYAAAYDQYRLFNWPNALGHAHMIYLNVLAETGIAGLVVYVFLWGSAFALTMRVIARATGWKRGLALGLLGAWTHLSTHQLVDNLYVNNIHFLLAAQLALLAVIARSEKDSALG
jgi:O-antigen ligase